MARALVTLRSPAHRSILLAALATPVGAATLSPGITRLLAFVVPATVLATLGLGWLLDTLLERLSPRLPPAAGTATALGLFTVLAAGNLLQLRTALVEGPLWYTDYGLYGMQYGAQQLFGEAIPRLMEADPDAHVVVTSDWANGAENFEQFFLTPEQQVRLDIRTVDAYLYEKLPLDEHTYLIMTRPEYARALDSPKLAPPEIRETIRYPDGNPGFYVARLSYVPNVEEVFAREREERRRPVEEPARVGGRPATLRHSLFDSGGPEELFDGDTFSLARVMEANPALLEIQYHEPVTLAGLAADFATMDFELIVELFAPGAAEPIRYAQTYEGLPLDPHVELPFDNGPHEVQILRLTVRDLHAGDVAKIHLREIDPIEGGDPPPATGPSAPAPPDPAP
jgi:hypothetical protein